MEFEWDDESKAGTDFRKHGVRIPDAIPVLDDPFAIMIEDDESGPDERRFVALGMGALVRLLVVLISVRSAEPHEREEYETGL